MPSPSVSQPLDRQTIRIALVIILGAIMSVLDTTIVNVALRTLADDLNSPLDDIQWVVTGYLLSLAAVIPVTGWAARRFGAKRLYLIALVAFTAGSALCGLAWSTGSLVAFRVLQGVGGGMLLPIGQMILVKAAGPQRMGRVMSVVGIPMVLAPVIGPALGGLLLDNFGWQWIFLVNVPIGIAAVPLALRILPDEAPDKAGAGRLDAAGLALLAPGLVAVTYGLAETGTRALSDLHVIAPVLVGIGLVVAFVARALRLPNPLLDVRLFGNRAFAAAAVTTFSLGAALFGAMILMPLYFQTVRGEDAVNTGLLLAPQGIGAGLAMLLSGRATDRWGGGPVALFGVLLTSLATVPFVLIGASESYWLIGLALMVRGFGIGAAFMPAMTAAFSVLRPDQINHATPQLTVLQRVGGSMGTAVFTVVLQGHLDDAARTPEGVAGAFGATYWWVLGVTLAGALPAVLLVRAERAARRAAARDDLLDREQELAVAEVAAA